MHSVVVVLPHTLLLARKHRRRASKPCRTSLELDREAGAMHRQNTQLMRLMHEFLAHTVDGSSSLIGWQSTVQSV